MKQDFACHASARQLLEMCFCPTTPGAQHTSEHTRNRAQQSSVLELEPTSILSSANLSPPLTWKPYGGLRHVCQLGEALVDGLLHPWLVLPRLHAPCLRVRLIAGRQTETFKILSSTSSVA